MKKTSEERALIRKEAEARRDPNKDRSSHERQRGAEFKTIGELSREDLSDKDFLASAYEMHRGTDRVAAVLGSAFVEYSLRDLLIQAFHPSVDPHELLDRPGAPLGTFAARTSVAAAFGVISIDQAREINIIRGVRNDFAHTILSIDFEHPAIVARCVDLTDATKGNDAFFSVDRADLSPTRIRFENLCWKVATALVRESTRLVSDKTNKLRTQVFLSSLATAGTSST